MAWYESAVEKIKNGRSYTYQELIMLIRAENPTISESSCKWGISGMLTHGLIARTGFNEYEILDSHAKRDYMPVYFEST